MLIIFDCDGVLVDSETLSAQVFSNALKKVGIDMSPQACLMQFQGWTLPACYQWLEQTFNVALPLAFLDTLAHDTQVAFDEGLKMVSGVERVLQRLNDNGVPFCVASNGSHKKIHHSLSLTGLLPYFAARFSVEDVEQGKPAPDLFLHAASCMGVPVSQTIVIEDSQSGWQASESAGMRSLIYAPHGKPAFACAQWFDSMAALPSLLLAGVNQ